jgi:hypothetical protein
MFEIGGMVAERRLSCKDARPLTVAALAVLAYPRKPS